MHLHSFSLYAACRQCTIPRTRHAYLPFVRVGAAARRARDARLGSTVRARQAGAIRHFSLRLLLTSLSFQALPRRDDLMPLTDPSFISKVLSEMPKETSQEAGAGTGWRGLGTVVQVTTLKP